MKKLLCNILYGLLVYKKNNLNPLRDQRDILQNSIGTEVIKFIPRRFKNKQIKITQPLYEIYYKLTNLTYRFTHTYTFMLGFTVVNNLSNTVEFKMLTH